MKQRRLTFLGGRLRLWRVQVVTVPLGLAVAGWAGSIGHGRLLSIGADAAWREPGHWTQALLVIRNS